jgi:hypothetical protein
MISALCVGDGTLESTENGANCGDGGTVRIACVGQ